MPSVRTGIRAKKLLIAPALFVLVDAPRALAGTWCKRGHNRPTSSFTIGESVYWGQRLLSARGQIQW